MRIKVKVIARASRDEVEKLREGEYKVRVRAVPENGKANSAVVAALSDEIGVPESRIRLISGMANSSKVFEIS